MVKGCFNHLAISKIPYYIRILIVNLIETIKKVIILKVFKHLLKWCLLFYLYNVYMMKILENFIKKSYRARTNHNVDYDEPQTAHFEKDDPSDVIYVSGKKKGRGEENC